MENLCLVTGACGFNGSYTVELLLEKGYKVRATDLEMSNRGVYTEIVKREGVEFIPSDLTKIETLEKVVKDVEYVYHPAAIFQYEAPWDLLYKVNVEGTRNLCEVLVKEKNLKRLVLWSTVDVYGLPKKEFLPINESYEPQPFTLYGKSKLEQEKVVMEYYKNKNMPVTIIRPAPVYGPRNFYGFAQILSFTSKLPAMVMFKDMPFSMPCIHVKDVCNSAIYLSHIDEAIGKIYNVIDDKTLSANEFYHYYFTEILGKRFITLWKANQTIYNFVVKIICYFPKILSKIIKHPLIIYFAETTPYITVEYRFSNEELKKTGYQFIYPTIKEGLPETIEWLKSKGMIK